MLPVAHRPSSPRTLPPRPAGTAVILLAVLACGAPGSDTVFTRALGGRGVAGSTSAQPVDSGRSGRPSIEVATWRGMYRRDGEESRFQPCGTARALDVTGTAEGRALLAERFRWNTPWQGLPMYGVLRGGMVSDTLEADPGSAGGVPRTRTRFFVTGVDTLRTWEMDCPLPRGGR